MWMIFKRFVIFLALLFTGEYGVGPSGVARANDIRLGVGGLLAGSTLDNNTGTGQAGYTGFGYVGEFRYRIRGGGSSDDSFVEDLLSPSIALFANYTAKSSSNTAAGLDETNKKSTYGGGLDFYWGEAFFGIQYGRSNSEISSATTVTNFGYNSFTGRLGWNFNLKPNRSICLMLGLTAEFGSFSAGTVSSQVSTEYTVFSVISIDIIKIFSGSGSLGGGDI